MAHDEGLGTWSLDGDVLFDLNSQLDDFASGRLWVCAREVSSAVATSGFGASGMWEIESAASGL